MTDCYKFVAAADRWFEAEWTCVTKGGHLASVRSAFENGFFVREGPAWCSDSYWIGGTNTEQGKWTWSDGKAFAYSNWDSGQPLNGSNRCLASATDTGKWSSEQCHLAKPFVCEVPSLPDDNRDPPTEPPVAATCPTPPQVANVTTAAEGVTTGCACETKPHGTWPTPHPFPQCPFGWSYVNVTDQCWKAAKQQRCVSS
ncbi:CLEC-50 protein [Aphelenchoides avenae]|nr:CLEC-50 protein [Aphelenchus avenae]